jgi:ADP-ribose pyrophosphatase
MGRQSRRRSGRGGAGELQEETGLIAGRLDYVGFLYFAYGMSDQGFHLYCATELVQGEATPEHTEQDLVVHRVSVREFEELCRDNVIQDSATVAAWALLKARWDSITEVIGCFAAGGPDER